MLPKEILEEFEVRRRLLTFIFFLMTAIGLGLAIAFRANDANQMRLIERLEDRIDEVDKRLAILDELERLQRDWNDVKQMRELLKQLTLPKELQQEMEEKLNRIEQSHEGQPDE